MNNVFRIALIVCLLAPVAVWAQNPVLRDLSCQAAGASTTDYTCALSVAPSGYVTGARYMFKADVANTASSGKPTVNLSSLGAKKIVKVAGGVTTELAANDIRAGQWVSLVYDGTNMQMQSGLGNALGRALVAADIPAALSSTTSVNGTNIAASKTLVYTDTAVLAAQMPALTGDCTTSAGGVATTCLKTNNVAFGNAATKNVGTTSGTVAEGNDSRFQTTNQQIRTIGATFDGGGTALSSAMASCVPVAFGGTISVITVTSDVAGNATITASYVARTSYTGPASATTVIGSASLSSATQAQTTGLSVTLPADSVVCFGLSSPATVTTVTANAKVAAN